MSTHLIGPNHSHEFGKNEKFRMTNLEWGVDFFRLDKFSQYFLRWTNLDSCFKKLTFLERQF